MSDAEDRSDAWWSRIPIYPVLLAFALMFVSYLGADISLWAALRPTLLVVAGSALALAIAGLLLRDVQLAGLMVASLVIVARTTDLLHVVAAVALLVLGAAVMVLFARMRRAPVLPAATRLFNFVSVILVAVLAVQAALSGLPARLTLDTRPMAARGSPPTGSASKLPDVYVLMLEDYPRADTLRRVFGYDNSAFLRALRDAGLRVAGNSHSDYMYTALNMSALFQMQYVEEQPTVQDWKAGRGTEPSLYGQVNDSPALDDLRAAGYAILSSAGRWEGEALRRADDYCGSGEINEFEFQRLDDSLIGAALDLLTPGWRAQRDRSVVAAEMGCLSQQVHTSILGPHFVFAHIEVPHIPVVFDGEGNPAPASVYSPNARAVAVSPEEFKRAYVDQLQWLNGRVLDLIGQIKAAAPTPPVIIVLSDEGSEYGLDWTNGMGSDLQERFGILFAASTPGRPNLFPDDVATVNVFSTLLNAYLGTHHPARAPRFFVSNAGSPMQTTEIGDPFAASSAPGS